MKNSHILIADSGSSKTAWCLLSVESKKMMQTKGISPYFMTKEQINDALEKELFPLLPIETTKISEVYFYGTGLADPQNIHLLKKVLEGTFINSEAYVTHDMMGAARALCGHEKGIACILGTGSNSCYYNGSKIIKNNPGLGYVLGDEGSAAILGKKVIQYYLYQTFDEELKLSFEKEFQTTKEEILFNIYKKPYPNRYLASFSYFLYEHRGHYMIENILEDALNDFFFYHVCKYAGSWEYPIHFTGGVAWAYKDIILELCNTYGMTPGNIIKEPIEGLVSFHKAEMNNS